MGHWVQSLALATRLALDWSATSELPAAVVRTWRDHLRLRRDTAARWGERQPVDLDLVDRYERLLQREPGVFASGSPGVHEHH